jgi:hypothetical protein
MSRVIHMPAVKKVAGTAWRRVLCAVNEIRVVNYSRPPSW